MGPAGESSDRTAVVSFQVQAFQKIMVAVACSLKLSPMLNVSLSVLTRAEFLTVSVRVDKGPAE